MLFETYITDFFYLNEQFFDVLACTNEIWVKVTN